MTYKEKGLTPVKAKLTPVNAKLTTRESAASLAKAKQLGECPPDTELAEPTEGSAEPTETVSEARLAEPTNGDDNVHSGR